MRRCYDARSTRARERRPDRYGVRSAQSTSICAETVIPDVGKMVNVKTRAHGRLGGLVTAERTWSYWPWL